MTFEFATAGRIVFGPGTRAQAAPAAAGWGQRALLVTGGRAEPGEALAAQLRQSGVDSERFAVTHEPDVATVQAGVAQARAMRAQVIIGLGGGSALDAGKAIAAFAANPGDVYDYLEVVGGAQPLTQDALPYLALPTTAGTGSEVTRNAVLGVPEQRLKVSVRGPRLLPRLAIVDPELTYDVPPAITAYTGLDALTQLLEPFVSNSANPLTDALCREGLRRAAVALRRAVADGADHAARADMALASLLGGLALANAKLGAVHGLAGPLGGRFAAPHGALCGRLLPAVVQANIHALQARAPASPALAAYAAAARTLTGSPDATLDDGVRWLRALVADLALPGLAAYGVTPADLDELVPLAQRASSMRGNPIPLTDDEVEAILKEGLHD
jgi:alcohol dehydrogenase class IV